MTTTTEDRQKMIDRIVQLMNLAENTPYAEEKASAQSKAAELMARYQIEASELCAEEETVYVEQDKEGSAPSIADLYLENAIGKFCGVFVVVVTRKSRRFIRVIGTKAAIDDHAYMTDLIRSQRKHQWTLYKANLAMFDKEPTTSEKTAFMNGYSEGLSVKIWDMLHKASKQFTEWGLVPLDPCKAAEDWYTQQHAVTTSTARMKTISNAGRVAGKRANLNRGVSYTGGNAILIA